MNKLSNVILLAFASLTISSYAAPPTVITSLPFNITIPGKYVLNQNLSSTSIAAIVISSGDVTLDLNGYTITGPGQNGFKGFGIEATNGNSVIPVSHIIIKNGTLANFREGVILFESLGSAPFGVTDSVVRNITISKDLIIQGAVEGNVVVNSKDVTP